MAELFHRLLAEPLRVRKVDGGQETQCIVVDGLDECGDTERNVLAETLGRYVPQLSPWLRVLAVTRDVSPVRGPLRNARRLELSAADRRNLEDVRAYFSDQLEEKYGSDPAWPPALEALTLRSGGIFLYAKVVVDGIQHGKLSIHDTNAFPEGLSQAFYDWFTWFFPDQKEYREEFMLPLGVLLATPEPMPEEELNRLFGWGENRRNAFLRRVEVLLSQGENDFRKKTLSLSHQYLREWLDTPEAERFQSSRRDALALMGERFLERFRENPEELTEYEALHLTVFLDESGNRAAKETAMNHNLLCRILDCGYFCETWGKLSTAMDCNRKAKELAERMTAERNTPEDRRDLSVSCNRVGDILQAQGDLQGALELYRRSMEIAEQLVAERNTPEDRQVLSICCERVGDILKAQDDLQGALELYRRGMHITEQLAQECNTLKNQWDLSVDCERIGIILKAQGDLSGALGLYRRGMEIAERLVRERNTLEDRRSLSVYCERVGDILLVQGDAKGALQLYYRRMEIAQQLVEERDALEDRRDLWVSYNRVGSILQAQGDLPGALKLYRRGMEIAEQLVAERNTPEDRLDLSVSCSKVGDVLQAQGNLPGALELYRRGMEIAEQLAADRGTPQDRRDLSVSCNKVGDILKAQGDLPGALELFRREMEIREQLTRERGSFDDWDDLAVSCYKLAQHPLVKREERLRFGLRGQEISERLYSKTGSERYQMFLTAFESLVRWLK